MSEVDLEVVRAAERTVYRAKLRHLEQVALAALAGRPGLALAPLWPPSPVIQIVAVDGVHLGRVRRDGPPSAAQLVRAGSCTPIVMERFGLGQASAATIASTASTAMSM